MTEKLQNILTVCAAALFLLTFSLWCWRKPADAVSSSERRALKQRPAANLDTLMNGSFTGGFEKYAADQFPLRDRFRMLKAFTVFYALGEKDNNGVYRAEGYISKLDYPLSKSSLDYAAERFHFLYKSYFYGKPMRIYLSVVPDKNYFLAQKNGYPAMDSKALSARLCSQMEYAQLIDITPELALSDYYKTDAHWRQERLVKLARLLAKKMGITLSAEYRCQRIAEPFYGVYSGQLALPVAADELSYLESDFLQDCTVYDYETRSRLPIYDLARARGEDPYEIFLSGAKPLLTIENPNATGELLLFRDSFGSSLAPLLAEGYGKITLVDIRYISPGRLGRLIEFTNQDVLFLYSATVLNSSETIK